MTDEYDDADAELEEIQDNARYMLRLIIDNEAASDKDRAAAFLDYIRYLLPNEHHQWIAELPVAVMQEVIWLTTVALTVSLAEINMAEFKAKFAHQQARLPRFKPPRRPGG